MTTPPPAGGPSGAPAGGPRPVPPKPVLPPRQPRQDTYAPGDGMLAWLPFRPTIRMRLTLLYGGMFLMAGVVLLLLMYFFVRQALHDVAPQPFNFGVLNANGSVSSNLLVNGQPMSSGQLNDALAAVHEARSTSALNTLLQKSLTVLVCLAVIAFAAGYALAGRVLRPLGRITRTARDVASSDLHRRIELDGPDDELKELADTFDGMLDRLDRSFDSQRRFVANASHELRTPLAINRTLLEVQLSDPAASPDLQQLGKTLLATNERSEQLVEGLLLLARSENELTDRRPVELSEVATRALEQTRGEADKREVDLRSKLDPAVVGGNGVLLERLALNLLQNAVRYNTPGGWVELATAEVPGGGELVVSNTGPVVPGYELEHIFEPFRRIKGADRTRSDKGVGLGLSIVRSVVRAHGGTIEATPRAGGGLTMRVRIPKP
ncbi:histidine kinase [Streptomyces rubellomurinus subsp. indigoferus]|uniref:histidine kinase n=2 Tax=Streptomyces TaxID=1883 RepID=A0A0F2TBJ2_STRR3|nr:histidine kinase [Streptomyces rubellomurinus subsp. indigoferus]KJS60568.1 histidine kinase [Streptomyces rubellomurinus]